MSTESARYYAVAHLRQGTLVHDGERFGALVRRAARNWVDRDTHPPMVRWNGRLPADEITWQELERLAEQARERAAHG